MLVANNPGNLTLPKFDSSELKSSKMQSKHDGPKKLPASIAWTVFPALAEVHFCRNNVNKQHFITYFVIILIFRTQICHVALLFLFLNGTQRPQNSVTGKFSAQCFWKYVRRLTSGMWAQHTGLWVSDSEARDRAHECSALGSHTGSCPLSPGLQSLEVKPSCA